MLRLVTYNHKHQPHDGLLVKGQPATADEHGVYAGENTGHDSLYLQAKHEGKATKCTSTVAPLSSVGSARDPCAEALQRTRVRLPARVHLLLVTPPLSPCFLSHSSAVLSEKDQKRKAILSCSQLHCMHARLRHGYEMDSAQKQKNQALPGSVTRKMARK